jgi:hypothetical protein
MYVQGDPLNFRLMLHWDGFSLTKTSLKTCWTLDLAILNVGKENNLAMMFIPTIKQVDCNVLSTFLKPLIKDLENVFLDGFFVQYAYPWCLISEHLSKVIRRNLVFCNQEIND